MQKIDLNGQWRMKNSKETGWIPAQVPGTVYHDLYTAGKVPDPYFRDNEEKITAVFDEDYEYEREFDGGGLLGHDRVLLRCEGLDTLAEISLNGQPVASTNNMHRIYEFDVKPLLWEGSNTLHVVLRSAAAWLDKNSTGAAGIFAKRSIQNIRMAQCAFGWDWGMSLPDAGIWKNISFVCYDTARIGDFQVLQHHGQGKRVRYRVGTR